MVSDEDKARFLRSVDLYVAPNTGGESFGIILVEAMSAGRPGARLRPGRLRPGPRPGRGGRTVRQRGRGRAGRRRRYGSSATRRAWPSCGSAAARTCGASTGRPSAADILSVYETVTRPARRRWRRPATTGARRRAAAAAGLGAGAGLTALRRARRLRRAIADSLAARDRTLIWILVVLVAIGLYLSWTAGRLDRLHARIDAARAALDAQLLRRASVAQELATSGVLDPAASIVLYEAAHARPAGRGGAAGGRRERAEPGAAGRVRGRPAAGRGARGARGSGGGRRAHGGRAPGPHGPPLPQRRRAAPPARCASTARSAGSGWPATPRFPMAFEMDDEPPLGPLRPSRDGVRRRSVVPRPRQNDPPPPHWPLLWTGPSRFLGAAAAPFPSARSPVSSTSTQPLPRPAPRA